MKKLVILFCLLAIGLFSGDAFALNAPAMQGGSPDNWYIEVQYNTGTSGVAGSAGHGMAMEWEIDSDTDETLGYTVHLLDADNALNFAGVVPSGTDTSHNLDGLGRPLIDGDVFLLQIRGYHSAVSTDGSVVEVTGTSGIEPDAGSYGFKVGTGYGFGFKADAADSTGLTALGSATTTYAPIWLDFQKGTD